MIGTSPGARHYQNKRLKGLCGGCGRVPSTKAYCKNCTERNKNYFSPNTQLRKELRTYGLTYLEYSVILDLQGNECAICGSLPDLNKRHVIDHDHTTGQVRGLLCHPCNRGLGQFQDDPTLLASAQDYLVRLN